MENQIFNGGKKQIIIAISIFLAIAVIGLGIYYFGIKQKADVANNTTGQSNSQTKENGKNILPQVKKLSCEDIKDVKAKATCQAGVIKLLNSDNNSVCQSLISEADKKTCLQAYLIKAAAQSGDLNKCQQAASQAMIISCTAQASFSLAIQKKDKKYCEKITNKTDKVNCLKVLAGMGVK